MFANTYAYFADKVTPVTLPDVATLVPGHTDTTLTSDSLTDEQVAALEAMCKEGFIHTFLVMFDCTCGLFFRKLTGVGVPFITISSRMGLSVRARQLEAAAKGTKPEYPIGLMLVMLFLQFCEADHGSKALRADFARSILGAKQALGK
jgi:hypothetical protein